MVEPLEPVDAALQGPGDISAPFRRIDPDVLVRILAERQAESPDP